MEKYSDRVALTNIPSSCDPKCVLIELMKRHVATCDRKSETSAVLGVKEL